VLERSDKQHKYSKKKAVVNLSKLNTAAAKLLVELKSMRLDLTGQITKRSDDLKDFQRNTDERLLKIEGTMSRLDKIDGLKTKQQQVEADVDEPPNVEQEEAGFVEAMMSLKKRLEHQEQYSVDILIFEYLVLTKMMAESVWR